MTSRRSIVLVGTGYFAQFHARAWQRMPGAGLGGVVAQDPAAGRAFVAEHAGGSVQVHDSLSALAIRIRPDIVDLVTPPESHEALIRECLSAAIPLVICQKPFCTDLAQAQRLVADIADSTTTVVVHENFRFQPWYREIHRLLSQGTLGSLYSARFDLRPGDGQGSEAYLARQPYFREQPEFLIRETGVHLVDVFRYLFGDVQGLFARLVRLNPVIRGEDAGTVLFDFAGGVRATLDGNRLADHAAQDPRLVMGEMCIEGAAGALRLDGDGRIRLRRRGEHRWREHGYRFQDIDFGGDCVYLCNAHVLDHLNTGSELVNTAADYLVNRQLEALIYRSHREGRWLAADEADEHPASG